MERVARKYEKLVRAAMVLNRTLALERREIATLSNTEDDTIKRELLRSGVIHNFEVAYEATWKFLKEYLEVVRQQKADSPRAVFLAAQQANLISSEILTQMQKLTTARNATSHTYNLVTAAEVYAAIEAYAHAIDWIVNAGDQLLKAVNT